MATAGTIRPSGSRAGAEGRHSVATDSDIADATDLDDSAALPDYQAMLGAYHRVFAGELRAMVAALPLTPGMRVLDLACGDGTYSPMLAARVGPSGSVVALDLRPSYLTTAREQVQSGPAAGARAPIDFVAANLDRLPFPPGHFDAAWCAQSLYSLPDPLEAVRRLRQAVRPGGVVGVLENDTLHHVLLPWPVEVELAIRGAELEALQETSDRPRKFYVARRLARLFRAAGLERVEVRTFATDRRGPLDGDLRTYLSEYLGSLADRVARRLADADRVPFERLIDPASDECLLDDPDLTLTLLDRVVWGVCPGA